MEITYGTNTFNFDSLPEASKLGLAKRGLTHLLGNEQAAKVTNWKKKFAEENKAEPGDDEIAAKKEEFVKAAVEAILAGTIGQGSRGPATDPIEAEMERIAKREITDIVRKNGGKWTGKGEERGVTFGDGTRLTMDEMLERRLANPEHEPRIRKEAEKAIKAAAKAADAAKAAGGLADVSAIG